MGPNHLQPIGAFFLFLPQLLSLVEGPCSYLFHLMNDRSPDVDEIEGAGCPLAKRIYRELMNPNICPRFEEVAEAWLPRYRPTSSFEGQPCCRLDSARMLRETFAQSGHTARRVQRGYPSTHGLTIYFVSLSLSGRSKTRSLQFECPQRNCEGLRRTFTRQQDLAKHFTT